MRERTKEERELVYRSLCGYANWLETGDFCTGAVDAKGLDGADAEAMRKRVVRITPEQRRLAAKLRALAAEEMGEAPQEEKGRKR